MVEKESEKTKVMDNVEYGEGSWVVDRKSKKVTLNWNSPYLFP